MKKRPTLTLAAATNAHSHERPYKDCEYTADTHNWNRQARTYALRTRLDGSLRTPSGVPMGHIGGAQ
jgi:hypothetical protein